jgi:hypothetical protein
MGIGPFSDDFFICFVSGCETFEGFGASHPYMRVCLAYYLIYDI